MTKTIVPRVNTYTVYAVAEQLTALLVTVNNYDKECSGLSGSGGQGGWQVEVHKGSERPFVSGGSACLPGATLAARFFGGWPADHLAPLRGDDPAGIWQLDWGSALLGSDNALALPLQRN